MKKWLLATTALWPMLAFGQTAVQQTGAVTSGDVAVWNRDHAIQSAASFGTGLKPFSVNDSLGPGVCVDSAAQGGAYSALCIGHDASGNALVTVDGVNGGAAGDLRFRVNGTTYSFPGTGSGNVVGPVTSTVGHFALFNSTSGQLLSDGGLAFSDFVRTINGTLTTPTINGGTITATAAHPNVNLIGSGDVTSIVAYGGAATADQTCITGADNTAALNAAVADGNTNIFFPAGLYCFKSRPATFTTTVKLTGLFGSSFLLRDYNEASDPTAGLVTWGPNAVTEGGLDGILIDAVTGTSGGAAVAFLSGANQESGHQILHNVVISYLGTGSWYSPLGADGSANATVGGLGWRDVVLDNVYLFNQAPGTFSAYLKSVVNWSAPRLWANSGVTITGTVGVPSNQLSLVGEILGELAFDHTSQCHALANTNTLIFDATADHCSFVGSVATGVSGITNNSLSTTVVADGQVMFSGGSLSLPLSAGQGTAFGDATVGLGLRGNGATYDAALYNSAGNVAAAVPHNTLNLNLFGGLIFSDPAFASCTTLKTVGGVLTCVP